MIGTLPDVQEFLQVHGRVDAQALTGGRQRGGDKPKIQLLFFGHHGEDIGGAFGRPGPPGFGAFQGVVQPAAGLVEVEKDLADGAVLFDFPNDKLFEFGGGGHFGFDAAEHVVDPHGKPRTCIELYRRIGSVCGGGIAEKISMVWRK